MKFSEAVKIQAGKKQSLVTNQIGKYPMYGSGGRIGAADDYICGAETVILGRKGTINNPSYSDTPCWIIDTAFGLIADQQILLPKYLYYFCCNFDFNKLNVSTSVIPSLKKSSLLQIDIAIPDIARQKEIVEQLDLISHMIDLKESELACLDDLIASRYNSMFNCAAENKRYKLQDICVKTNGIKCGPFGVHLRQEDYQSSGIPVWEIPQINSSFSKNPTHYISIQKANQLKVFALKPGDIVMSRKGYVGKCTMFPTGLPAGVMHSDLLRIRADTSIVDPCFLLYQLHSSTDIQRQIRKITSGSITDGINVKQLNLLGVFVPDLSLQNQFTSFVVSVNNAKMPVWKCIDELKGLQGKLMQEYFDQ